MPETPVTFTEQKPHGGTRYDEGRPMPETPVTFTEQKPHGALVDEFAKALWPLLEAIDDVPDPFFRPRAWAEWHDGLVDKRTRFDRALMAMTGPG